MAEGSRGAGPPVVEPVPISDVLATGCTVYDDGVLTWITWHADRHATITEPAHKVVVSRIVVPSAQFARMLRVMAARPELLDMLEAAAPLQ